jgi:hypothetical protein
LTFKKKSDILNKEANMLSEISTEGVMITVQKWVNEGTAEYQNCCFFYDLDKAVSFVQSQKYNHPYRILKGGAVVWSEDGSGKVTVRGHPGSFCNGAWKARIKEVMQED